MRIKVIVMIVVIGFTSACAQRFQTRPPTVAIVGTTRETHSFEVRLKLENSDFGSFYHAILEGTELEVLTRRQFHISVLRVDRVSPKIMKHVRAKLDQIVAGQDQKFVCIFDQVVLLTPQNPSNSGLGVRCAREDEEPIRQLNARLTAAFEDQFPDLMSRVPQSFQPHRFSPALEVADPGSLRLLVPDNEDNTDRRQKAIAEINDRLKLTSNRRWPFTLTLKVF